MKWEGRVAATFLGRIGAIAVAASALSGCISYAYVDAQNLRHIIGFVDIVDERDSSVAQPSLTALTTFGLSAYSLGDSSGIAVGYSHELLMSVPDNACIDLTRPGPCHGLQQSTPKISRGL